MKYIIFNWKSYLNLKETISLSKIISNLPSSKKFKLVSSPNNFFNLAIKSRFPKNTLATQNIDFHGSGANTGSLNINHLIENKIKYSILGHSEVRSNFGDSDTIVKIKLDLCLSHNIIPIVCVGETKDVYKSNKTKIFLKSQINKIFDKFTSYNEVILAYEPLWSIGTGLTPKIDEIEEISSYLSKILKNYSFKKINILYGGSVNLTNISDILNLRNVNGVLVGSASTKSDFIKYFK
jgi:triosephosphate isomerase